MDGLWTYTIPLRASGGTLVIRDGKVAGGDGTYVCSGTCDVEGDTVRMTLFYEMFNPRGSLGSAWGDNPSEIEVLFEGGTIGDIINGEARRSGFEEAFAVTMLRHGDAP